MSDRMQKVIDEWNETSNSEWYMSYRTDEVIQNILKNPISAFHHTTWDIINNVFPSLKDKKICVPSNNN